ncbi:response regulator [Polymorphobacter multimanifer]|uniref:CheY-like chemotaxis protein n=1 Tax=Polymorphobacter multimanifer TaxID=1070431 RepID=A0A841L713_9SPHN|nr:response regulator [Polymorphobacter multimanifer]MBB6226743.1 CheY-like chemotaxis protein [Polymorphobacter multimanifer]GGI71282.1 response regulator [Polymorphobacter multimanifer]
MTANVLLIEDNEQNRYLATFLLEKHGYSVEAALDGVSGVEKATVAAPDIVSLDIQLPGMDGYQVAQALRRIGAMASVPIVAVTSYAMPLDREKALAAGCNGYIEKPIDPDSFVQEISRFLPSPAPASP